MSYKGSLASQLLSQKDLKDCGLATFKYTAEGAYNKFIHKVSRFFNVEDHVVAVQKMSDNFIEACTLFVTDKTERNNRYHDTYIQEALHIIDGSLQNNKDTKTNIEFEVSLKQHICGFAASEFQKMHKNFIQTNDPYKCLLKTKEKFRADFKDLFHERDQCQKKAEEFTNQCLKPAIEDFVYRKMGPDVIDEMLTREEFSTRMSFQYSTLQDLLLTKNVHDFLSYSHSYETFVKKRILQQIKRQFSSCSATLKIEDRHLKSSVTCILDAINTAKSKKGRNLQAFVEDLCKELGDKLVISQYALGVFMVLNNADQEQFAHWLSESVRRMAECLQDELTKTLFDQKLKKLNLKPQNELFTRVIGCGKQCPFCAVPCEAGGKDHTEHFASLHRPQGFGQFRWIQTGLITDICSSLVISDKHFCCNATNNEWHSYKCYKDIFPLWKIPPDVSLQASDYWKYVMTKYNNDLAKEYNAQPADIPSAWRNITEIQAKASLEDSFHIK
ncbi:hypothetical protein ILYODFUR_020419 [Ilyodon furcidens]|uniref:Interferon-induced very large GTPase 1 n=1 Tax=Ilyodon furcidens TaxID=33524 RepID=A0ABV0TCL0_9TELE